MKTLNIRRTITLRCNQGFKDRNQLHKVAGISKRRFVELMNRDEPTIDELIGLCRTAEVTFDELDLLQDIIGSDFKYEVTNISDLIEMEDADSIVDLFTLGILYEEDGKLYLTKDKVEVSSEDAAKICRILFDHNFIITACRIPEFYKILGLNSVSKCRELGDNVLSIALSNPTAGFDLPLDDYNSQSVAFLNYLPIEDRRYILSEIHKGTLDSAKTINRILKKKRLAFYEDYDFLSDIAHQYTLMSLKGVKECDDIFEADLDTCGEMIIKIMRNKRILPSN